MPITSPGCKPSFAPSIVYVFIGTTYLQSEQLAGVMTNEAVVDDVLTFAVDMLEGFTSISSVHLKNDMARIVRLTIIPTGFLTQVSRDIFNSILFVLVYFVFT